MKKIKKIEDNIIEDVRNLFRLKKEIDKTAVKDIRNLFRLKKNMKQSKTESLEILGTFLSIKKKIFTNQ